MGMVSLFIHAEGKEQNKRRHIRAGRALEVICMKFTSSTVQAVKMSSRKTEYLPDLVCEEQSWEFNPELHEAYL